MATATINIPTIPKAQPQCPMCGPACRMLEQAAWSDEQFRAYTDTPIPFVPITVETYRRRCFVGRKRQLVELGLKGPHCYWSWRPYEQRPENHREDYDRLVDSIRRHGIKTPVLGWMNPETGRFHVLVGQRRVEIAIRLGIRRVRALCITEDARRYWEHDIERINRHLKPAAGEWSY